MVTLFSNLRSSFSTAATAAVAIKQRPQVYFPTAILTLLRGSQRASNEALFKVPAYLNKLDLTQLLEKLYGLHPLRILSLNMHGKEKRIGRSVVRSKAWKKALVTLDHDWVYPSPSSTSTLSEKK